MQRISAWSDLVAPGGLFRYGPPFPRIACFKFAPGPPISRRYEPGKGVPEGGHANGQDDSDERQGNLT